MSKNQVCVEGVRFRCSSGRPMCEEIIAELDMDESVFKGGVVRLENGPTGYESFVVELVKPEGMQRMIDHGWWACAGTPGRWDSLYISGLQMKKMLKELGLYDG